MEIVTDMGPHGLYIWPAYGAFVLIFAGLVVWAWRGNARAKAELARLEGQK
ncbi:MAG: heme exporter protein CcmD [Pseudomonadota bacterium]